MKCLFRKRELISIMNSPSPKALKKSQNFLRKVGQKVEQTFHLSNSNVFHGSLSSLNDLPDSYYHRELGDSNLQQDDTVSLQNLPEYDLQSPKIKLRKKHGKPSSKNILQMICFFHCSCSTWSITTFDIFDGISFQCSMVSNSGRIS